MTVANANLGMPGSYYAATANPFDATPRLRGEVQADVCVIGGGCTGLSAALHAAEAGLRVVLLESGLIGWGASGRHGGQMIPGLRQGAAELVARYGAERARRLFGLAVEARDLVVQRIQQHQIACDLKTSGHLLVAAKRSDLAWMQREAQCLAACMHYPHVALLSAAETAAEVCSRPYFGGLLDRAGGHFHALNYATGLASAAQAAGVALYERSAALQVREAEAMIVRTAAGSVRARYVVLACDALLGPLEPRIAAHVMPVASFIATTEPLAQPDELIRHDRAIADTLFAVNYFRMTADGRLLFGGGERYTPRLPPDIAAFVRPRMQRVFPALRGYRIEYAWGGWVSITTSRLPHVGRLGNLFYAQGYSGQGAILSTQVGRLIAEALCGTAERFDVFGAIAPERFIGGTALRTPLYVAGMLWYALRDRLG